MKNNGVQGFSHLLLENVEIGKEQRGMYKVGSDTRRLEEDARGFRDKLMQRKEIRRGTAMSNIK
jgi:hypothetical protein